MDYNIKDVEQIVNNLNDRWFDAVCKNLISNKKIYCDQQPFSFSTNGLDCCICFLDLIVWKSNLWYGRFENLEKLISDTLVNIGNDLLGVFKKVE